MRALLCLVLAAVPSLTAADWTPAPVAEATIWDCVEAAGDNWHAGARCIGGFATACISDAGLTDSISIAQCMETETQAWDAVLNTAYQSLRADLAGPDMLPVAAEALRDAQRAWIPFRDAECLSRGNLTTGTGHFEDGAACMMRVTATRALDLIGYGGQR